MTHGFQKLLITAYKQLFFVETFFVSMVTRRILMTGSLHPMDMAFIPMANC
jgi:hypothetical protein